MIFNIPHKEKEGRSEFSDRLIIFDENIRNNHSVVRWDIVKIIAIILIVDVLTLALPLFAQTTFDYILAHKNISAMSSLVMAILFVILIECLLVYVSARQTHILSAQTDNSLTTPILNKLLNLPLIVVDAHSKGKLLSDIQGIQRIRDFLSASSVTAAVDVIFLIILLVILFWYSLLVGAVVLISLPVLIVMSMIFRKTVANDYSHYNDNKANFDSSLTEGLHAITTIKTLAIEPLWLNNWKNLHSKFIRSGLIAKRGAAIEETFVRLLQRVISVLVLWVGAYEVSAGVLSYGKLLACYIFTLRAMIPASRLFQIYMGLVRLRDSRARLKKLEQLPEEQSIDTSQPINLDGDVNISDLFFSYPNQEKMMLTGVSLKIYSGSFLGIVGSSGSGKSTLAKLLQRHLIPSTGNITVGGQDIAASPLAAYRRSVMLVNQDAVMFQGSIRLNLTMGLNDVSDLEIERACVLACASSFIQELPKGLDTVVDEKSSQFSTGQRQRLTLARAILHNPKILILDEATNALDAETEAQVLGNLRNDLKFTLIVVTHREHVLKHATEVVEMRAGRLLVRPHQLLEPV